MIPILTIIFFQLGWFKNDLSSAGLEGSLTTSGSVTFSPSQKIAQRIARNMLVLSFFCASQKLFHPQKIWALLIQYIEVVMLIKNGAWLNFETSVYIVTSRLTAIQKWFVCWYVYSLLLSTYIDILVCTGYILVLFVIMFFCCGGVEGQVPMLQLHLKEQDTLELHMFCLDLGTQHDSQEIKCNQQGPASSLAAFFSHGTPMLGVGFSSRSCLNSLGCWMILEESHMASSWKRWRIQNKSVLKTTWNTDRDKGIYRKQVQHNYENIHQLMLMAEILHHLGCKKTLWLIYHIKLVSLRDFWAINHIIQVYHHEIFHIWPGRSWWRKRYKCQLKCPDHVHCQMTQVPPNGVADWSF